MKNLLKDLKNNIFISSILVALIFIVLNSVLAICGIMFRQRVYEAVSILITLGIVIRIHSID